KPLSAACRSPSTRSTPPVEFSARSSSWSFAMTRATPPRAWSRRARCCNGAAENYVCRVSAVDALVDQALVAYAMKKYSAKKPGMILINNAWGESNEAGLKVSLAGENLPYAGIEKFQDADVDVVPQLTRLKDAGADVLFMVANVAPSSQVVKSLDRMGWNVPIVSHWGPAGGRFSELAGPSGQRVHFIQTFSFSGKLSP